MANKNQAKIVITEAERAFSTLTASGLWSQAGAHRICFPDSKIQDDTQRRQLGSVVSQKDQVRAYKQTALLSWVAEKDKAVAVGIGNTDSDYATGTDGKMTKDDIRRLMTVNIMKEPDPARQNKLLTELANLDALRGNDDDGNKDERVLYYLPLTCNICSSYKKDKEKKI